jgi:hypothetical protein
VAVFSFCRVFYPEAHFSTEDLSGYCSWLPPRPSARGFLRRRELTRKELFIRKSSISRLLWALT